MLRSRAAEGNILISVAFALCWILVMLRVYVRTFMVKCFGMDDWLLLVALATFTVYSTSALLAISHGVGTDPHLIPPSELPYAIFFWWLAFLFYNLATIFVRLSISVFIHKLCISRTHKIIIWTTASLSLAFSTFYFFLTIFQCNPPSYFWTKYTGRTSGVCLDAKIFPIASYAQSAASAIADWVLGLFPIWLIWDLQMRKRAKISVGILLGMGVLAGCAGVIRIPYIRTLNDKKTFLYNVIDVSIWSFVEASLGIIAASASALRPLFKKFYDISTYHSHSHKLHAGPKSQVLHSNTGAAGASHTHASAARAKTFYKHDDSSLELGVRGGDTIVLDGNVQGDSSSGGGGRVESRSGSEENLTGGGKGDILVRTSYVVERGTGRGRS